MREVTIQLHQFDELSDSAKDEAIDSLKSLIMFSDNWWQEHTGEFFVKDGVQYMDFAALDYSTKPKIVHFHHLMVRDVDVFASEVTRTRDILNKIEYNFQYIRKGDIETNSFTWYPKEGVSFNQEDMGIMQMVEIGVNNLIFKEAKRFFEIYQKRQQPEYVIAKIKENSFEFFSDGSVYFPPIDSE